MFFSLVLFILVMVGILSVRSAHKGPAILAAASGYPLYRLWEKFNRLEWKLLPLEKLAELDGVSDARLGHAAGQEYVQPECAEPAEKRRTSSFPGKSASFTHASSRVGSFKAC